MVSKPAIQLIRLHQQPQIDWCCLAWRVARWTLSSNHNFQSSNQRYSTHISFWKCQIDLKLTKAKARVGMIARINIIAKMIEDSQMA